MGMTFSEMDDAINDAKAVLFRADSYRLTMVKFLIGRLRGISPTYLKILKKELSNFNSRTEEWKN